MDSLGSNTAHPLLVMWFLLPGLPPPRFPSNPWIQAFWRWVVFRRKQPSPRFSTGHTLQPGSWEREGLLYASLVTDSGLTDFSLCLLSRGPSWLEAHCRNE